jgi:hypothetical protein
MREKDSWKIELHVVNCFTINHASLAPCLVNKVTLLIKFFYSTKPTALPLLRTKFIILVTLTDMLNTTQYSPCHCLSFAGTSIPTYGFFYAPESAKDKSGRVCGVRTPMTFIKNLWRIESLKSRRSSIKNRLPRWLLPRRAAFLRTCLRAASSPHTASSRTSYSCVRK